MERKTIILYVGENCREKTKPIIFVSQKKVKLRLKKFRKQNRMLPRTEERNNTHAHTQKRVR